MDKVEEGPAPDDIVAWRQVIESQVITRIRGHCLVAAIQKIGPSADQRIINALMKEVSDRIMRILRKLISRNHRNAGWDMIEEAHGKLIEAVLRPESADGSAMRTAFVATIRFRGADAIAREQLHRDRYSSSEEEMPAADEHDELSAAEERAHAETVLRRISDPRKRLAYRLHLQGVPRNSTKVNSIASALGVSAKTAETWVKEVEEEIGTTLGVKP